MFMFGALFVSFRNGNAAKNHTDNELLNILQDHEGYLVRSCVYFRLSTRTHHTVLHNR